MSSEIANLFLVVLVEDALVYRQLQNPKQNQPFRFDLKAIFFSKKQNISRTFSKLVFKQNERKEIIGSKNEI